MLAFNLPSEILNYWNANTFGLPKLWFEFAAEGNYPPVAIFWCDGFRREYATFGLRMDQYRYKFTILGLNPVETYELGYQALTYMNDFEPTGFIQTNPTPEQFATPSETGQANIWQYQFAIDFLVQPSS